MQVRVLSRPIQWFVLLSWTPASKQDDILSCYGSLYLNINEFASARKDDGLFG